MLSFIFPYLRQGFSDIMYTVQSMICTCLQSRSSDLYKVVFRFQHQMIKNEEEEEEENVGNSNVLF